MLFPKLPLLETLLARFQENKSAPLAGVRMVCVQHLLDTTGSLLESFVRLGCHPANIHVLGKFCSSNPTVAARLKSAGFDVVDWQGQVQPGQFSKTIRHNIPALWSRAESRLKRSDRALLIMDDGGRCRQYCPLHFKFHNVVDVEQTTRLKRHRNGHWIPTVEVAGSAAKRTLEPSAVTASIMRYVVPKLRGASPHSPIGVVGLGTVGADLANSLRKSGFTVAVYDKNPELRRTVNGAKWCGSLKEIFAASDYILGCTGDDLLLGADWVNSIKGDKVLASCSTEDIEFRSLLALLDRGYYSSGPLRSALIRLPKGSLKILRGGFPANFTGTKNSGPVSMIQVTRALLLAGVIQAAHLSRYAARNLPHRIMLDPQLQAVVARSFLHASRTRLIDPVRQDVLDPNWLSARSTGVRKEGIFL
jgi:S-adenosylhomocysteine hydrolase